MFDGLRPQLNHATVVAYLALFVALGGVSYGVATGSIDSREIKNGSVRSKDLRNNGVRGKDIRKGTVKGSDVGDGSLTGDDIGDGSLTGDHIVESSLANVPSATKAGIAVVAGGLLQARRDAEISLPAGNVTQRTLLSLNVPAGNYLIHGSTSLDNEAGTRDAVFCFLRAGANFDQSRIALAGDASGGSDRNHVSLMLAHTYTAPGTITLTCDGGVTAGDIEAEDRKIQAYQVAAVTSTAGSGP